MDGFESVRRYRAYEKDHFLVQHGRLFIVGTSANIDTVSKQTAMAAGMDAFVDKPFNYEDVMKVVTSEVGARVLKPSQPMALAAATSLPTDEHRAATGVTVTAATRRGELDVRGL